MKFIKSISKLDWLDLICAAATGLGTIGSIIVGIAKDRQMKESENTKEENKEA